MVRVADRAGVGENLEEIHCEDMRLVISVEALAQAHDQLGVS